MNVLTYILLISIIGSSPTSVMGIETSNSSSEVEITESERITDPFIVAPVDNHSKMDVFIRANKALIGGFGFVILMLSFLYGDLIRKPNKRYVDLKAAHEKLKIELYALRMSERKEGRKEEQKRIAQELHDGILSELFGIRFMLSDLCEKSDAKSIETRKIYIEELKILEEEIRNISHSYDSENITTRADFLQILEEYLIEQKRIHGLDFNLNGEKDICWEKVESDIQMDLYRIVQESVHNTLKYASATSISIQFKSENNDIKMEVIDDGNGFDLSKTSKGIGLKNIESRISKWDGTLDLTSNSLGTAINIVMPLN